MAKDTPLIRKGRELAKRGGMQVRLKGDYVVQDIGGYKEMVEGPDGTLVAVHQIAHIRLSDDQLVKLAGRPLGEMKALEGQTVVATGTLTVPQDSERRSILRGRVARAMPMPTLVDVTEVEPVDA